MSNSIELEILLFITRHLPKIRGAGIISNFLKKIYNRKPRKAANTTYKNLKLYLPTQSEILFAPQLRDRDEISFVKKHLKLGDNFVDIGANMGFYSLIATELVGNNGKVLAVEPDKDNFEFLTQNIKINKFIQISAVNNGVSDCEQTITFYKNKTNNELGSFVKQEDAVNVNIECSPLLKIIKDYKIEEVSFLKIDTEGYEYIILSCFFKDAPISLFPKYIMFENDSKEPSKTLKLLLSQNYQVVLRNKNNIIMQTGNKV